MKKHKIRTLLEHIGILNKPANPIPVSLQEAIEACTTIEQLKTLLLSKEVVLDEAMMAAFDKRIAELEQQTGKPFLF